jgi:hypothetical protein
MDGLLPQSHCLRDPTLAFVLQDMPAASKSATVARSYDIARYDDTTEGKQTQCHSRSLLDKRSS